MKNYERYKSLTAEDCKRELFMLLLCRIPADRKIIPYLSTLKGKKILDVGCGSGFYTKLLIEKNKVVGIDQNPHLCRLSIPLHKGDATDLSTLVGGEKFDVVLSTWMTEYLNPEQLNSFLSEVKKVLNKQGIFISTFISTYCLGYTYVKLAKILKGIDKYCYPKKEIINKLKNTGFTNIKIINLNSWLYIPWAYLVVAEK
ncbi:MAG: class I SAM-dependent methyltransferase [Phycisphaerae bacterium]|nr:class I SAM-dependent methyltransferase [Phycisphaerae bacterium]